MRTQKGQVVLITLLVLTIATTVALSLISRTTTDSTITAQAEESSRAFSAAEAGIEDALKRGIVANGSYVLTPGVSYTVDVSSIGAAVGLYEFPKKTLKGVTETLWLTGHDAVTGAINEADAGRYTASTIGICWSSEAVIPALAVTVLYKSGAEYRVAKIAYDPDTFRSPPNQFTQSYVAGGCGGNTNTAYKETLDFTAFTPAINPISDVLIALRIRPLYSDTKIWVDAVTTLPLQGNKIESIGSTATGTNRKIVVYQQYRAPSTIFDAALYSQGNIRK